MHLKLSDNLKADEICETFVQQSTGLFDKRNPCCWTGKKGLVACVHHFTNSQAGVDSISSTPRVLAAANQLLIHRIHG